MNKLKALIASAVALSAIGVAAPAASAATVTAQTTENVWAHNAPNTATSSRTRLVPGGTRVTIDCYTTGATGTTDNVWYFVGVPDQWVGYIAGFYLNTGHDPASGIRHC